MKSIAVILMFVPSLFCFPFYSAAWNEPQEVRGFKFASSPEEAITVRQKRVEELREQDLKTLGIARFYYDELKSIRLDEHRKMLYADHDRIGEIPVFIALTFLDNKMGPIYPIRNERF